MKGIYKSTDACNLPLPTSRKLAIKLNIKHYFTGKPCKRNHVCHRYATNGVCIECSEINSKDFKDKYPDFHPKYHRQYYEDNAVFYRENRLKYAKNNPDKVNALNAKRRAKKLNQTPPDANHDLINHFYSVAKELNEIYGSNLEVDHIIPLDAGGLHHEDNLQLLPQKLNASKGAKTDWIHPNIID